MTEICSKENCSGCGLCIAICSKKAITLQKGKLGHLYPVIDQKKCIDCGLCHKRCPANNTPQLSKPQKAFAAFSKDTNDYKTSTSGAAASVFSNYFIEQGGVVYGCAVCNIDNKTIDIKHIRVTTKEELPRLKGSKYVQSRIVEILPLLKEDVKNGKKVLFVGTPCQAAAVRNLFPKVPDNLWIVDIICHGVPSLSVLKKHIRNKTGNHVVDNVRFREGAKYCISFLSQGNIIYSSDLFKERYKDEYYNSFFDGYTSRDSCNRCKYANPSRVSDVTIGDFWGLGRVEDSSMIKEHDEGISVILPITNKGIELIQSISYKLHIYERKVEEAINGNDQLRVPKALSFRIRLFKKLYTIFPFSTAYKLSITDIRLKLCIKRFLKLLKVDKLIKTCKR